MPITSLSSPCNCLLSKIDNSLNITVGVRVVSFITDHFDVLIHLHEYVGIDLILSTISGSSLLEFVFKFI